MDLDHDKLFLDFRQHCRETGLIQTGHTLLLAVSGGVDSRVLLDLFRRLRDEWELFLAIGHVNHMLRGRESDEDAGFVAKLAKEHQLPFYQTQADVSEYARDNKVSLETAGRKLRYRALENMRRKFGADAIVTAHNRDDQAETVLAHLIRGAGLRGLAGMAPGRSEIPGLAVVLRPLLPFSRQSILDYARQHHLSWREDTSNQDMAFQRNRIRGELIPLIHSQYNPGIRENLYKLSRIAGLADAYFQREAEQALAGTIREQKVGKIVLDIQRFWRYFYLIQAYAVRMIMRRVTGSECSPTFDETEHILSLLRPESNFEDAAAGSRYIWRNQVEVAVGRTGVAFSRIRPTLPVYQVEIGKRCSIHEAGVALTVERASTPTAWRQAVHSHSQFVDAEKVSGSLRLRFPRPGDRFRPLGMRDFKKLSDFFVDLKVPRYDRSVIPVLECETGIIWICGYRLDDRYKIQSTTTSVLHLKLEPLPVSKER